MSVGLDVLHRVAAGARLDPPLDHFFFVRHGETEGNASRVIQHPTIPLNERGREQAERAGRIMARERFDRIACSTFTRARQTAEAIERHTGAPVTEHAELSERLFGELVGTSAEDIDWTANPKGGETLEQFVERTGRGFTTATAAGGTPVIVAHGGNLRVIAAGLGVELPLGAVGNAQPLLFQRGRHGWTIELLHEMD